MRIHHLALRTSDLAALEKFYAEVLGLAVAMRQGEHAVWLRAGGTIVMLEKRDPDEPAVPQGSRELVAFAVSPEDLGRMRRTLAAAGVAVESETAFTIYFRDPDGRRLGLSHYPLP